MQDAIREARKVELTAQICPEGRRGWSPYPLYARLRLELNDWRNGNAMS